MQLHRIRRKRRTSAVSISPRKDNKIEQLQRLDSKVKTPGKVVASILGVVGALVMGSGMALVMVWENMTMGLAPSIPGMIVALLAFPAYAVITNSRKKKYASEILSLESSKYIRASVVAYAVGISGTVFMAGSVFSITADKLIPCIVLAIPAFIGWGLPYFLYRGIMKKKTAQVTPLIDQKYDELYAVCEKANCLLDKIDN